MKSIDMIVKDLKIIFSDKKALAIMILMPIILTTILSFALKGSFLVGSNISKIQISIVKKYDKVADLNKIESLFKSNIIRDNVNEKDLDNILNSVQEMDIEEIFFDDFLQNEEIAKIIEYRVIEEEMAYEQLKKGEISSIIILPENYIYNMSINLLTPFRNLVDIKVVGHPDKQMGYQITEAIMKGFTDMTSSLIIGKNVFVETAMEEDLGNEIYEEMGVIMEDMAKGIEDRGVMIEYVNLEGKNPISSFAYYSVGMTTMFILFAASYGSKTLLEEKNNQTYQRMAMAGTSKWKIVTGKFLTIFFVAIMQIFTMILYSTLVLKVDWGNPLLVILTSIAIVFAVSGMGIMIAALTYTAGNYKMANVFETAIIQSFALFGGSFFPIHIMPKVLRKLSYIAPNGLALRSFIKIMMGYGLNEIVVNLSILILIGLVFSIIAVYVLKEKRGWSSANSNKIKTIRA